MELRFKLKPYSITVGNTKATALGNSRIRNLVFTVSSTFGVGYTEVLRNDYVYVYTSQKYRAKRNVRKASWEIYVYKIPVAILQAMKLKVKQKLRTFELTAE